ncbi:hypothetical protein GCM10009424_30550 [Sphingomonas ursincola]
MLLTSTAGNQSSTLTELSAGEAGAGGVAMKPDTARAFLLFRAAPLYGGWGSPMAYGQTLARDDPPPERRGPIR